MFDDVIVSRNVDILVTITPDHCWHSRWWSWWRNVDAAPDSSSVAQNPAHRSHNNWFTIYTRTKKNNFYEFNQVLCNHSEYTDVREEVWHRNCCLLLIYQSQLLIQSSLQQWIQWVMLVMIMRVVSLILMIYLHSMSGTECVLKIVIIKEI